MKFYRNMLVLCMILGMAGAALAGVSVSRMEFTRGVMGREPLDNSTVFPANVGKVYCFTQFIGATDNLEVIHIWTYKGEKQLEVKLTAEEGTFRTWSNKKIDPKQKGEWKVEVKDTEGNTLSDAVFTVE